MINEVNNIIYNTLVAERAIHLPGVGTLSVVRKSAEKVSSDLIMPPSYAVEFSSQGVATSLVDAISHEAGVDVAQAEDIYLRWLEKVRTDSTLQVEGVGRLQYKSFIADKDFVALFNTATTPVKIKRNNSKAIYVALISTLIGVGTMFGVAAWFFFNEVPAPTTEVIEQSYAPMLDVVEAEDATTEEVVEEVIIEESVEPIVTETADAVDDWTQRADIRHRVVAGSYSTPENANIAMNMLTDKHDGIKCEIFSLGKMYAVAVYGSANRDECVQFMCEYGDELENMWIFTPKKYQ